MNSAPAMLMSSAYLRVAGAAAAAAGGTGTPRMGTVQA
jgi:hypothetical protein